MVKVAAVDSERTGGGGPIPLVLGERLLDQGPLKLPRGFFQADVLGDCRFAGRRTLGQARVGFAREIGPEVRGLDNDRLTA